MAHAMMRRWIALALLGVALSACYSSAAGTAVRDLLLLALDDLGEPQPAPEQLKVLGAAVGAMARQDAARAVETAQRLVPEEATDALIAEAVRSCYATDPQAALRLTLAIEDAMLRDTLLLELASACSSLDPRAAGQALRALDGVEPSGTLVVGVCTHLAAVDVDAAADLADLAPDERSLGIAVAALARHASRAQLDGLADRTTGLSDPAARCYAHLGLGLGWMAQGDRQAGREHLDAATELLGKVKDEVDARRLRQELCMALGPDGTRLLSPDVDAARRLRRPSDLIEAWIELIEPLGRADNDAGTALATEALNAAAELPDHTQMLTFGVRIGLAVTVFNREQGATIADQAARACLPTGSRPIDDPIDRARVLASAAQVMLAHNPERALNMLRVAVQSLAEAGPEAAGGLPPEVLDSFAISDFGSTHHVVLEMPDPSRALCRLAGHVAPSDPERALALVAEAQTFARGPAALTIDLATRVAPALAHSAPEAAVELAGVAAPPIRDAAVAAVISGMDDAHAAACLATAAALHDPSARVEALSAVARGMAAVDPPAALSVAELVSSDPNAGLRQRVLLALAQYDPEDAISLASALPEGAVRDVVLAEAARRIVEASPEQALRVAGEVTDTELRVDTLCGLITSGLADALTPALLAIDQERDPRHRAVLLARVAASAQGAPRAAEAATEALDLAARLGEDAFAPAAWSRLVADLALCNAEEAFGLARATIAPDTRARACVMIGLALPPEADRSAAFDLALASAASIADARTRMSRFRQTGLDLITVDPDRARTALQHALEAAMELGEPRARTEVAIAVAQLDVSTGASWAYAVGRDDPVEAINALCTIGSVAAEREPIRAALALSQAAQLTDAMGATTEIEVAHLERMRAEQLIRVAREMARVPDGVEAARDLLTRAQQIITQLGDVAVVSEDVARDLAVTGIVLAGRADLAAALAQADDLPDPEARARARVALAGEHGDEDGIMERALDDALAVEDPVARLRALKQWGGALGRVSEQRAMALVNAMPPGDERAEAALAAARALGEKEDRQP